MRPHTGHLAVLLALAYRTVASPLNIVFDEFDFHITLVPTATYVAQTSDVVPATNGPSILASLASSVVSVSTPGIYTSLVTSPTTTASPPAVTTSGNSTSTQSSGPGDIDIAAVLTQHNIHRSNHSASPLIWDANLATIAAQIAASCVYAHNTAAGGGGYGQNIGAGTSASDVPSMITNEMYNDEFGWYPQPWGTSNPDTSNFEHWGHLSQIVWASTTSVGCAWQDCSSGGLANTGGGVQPWFTVCNYGPPGNFAGEYQNVHAPTGAAVTEL